MRIATWDARAIGTVDAEPESPDDAQRQRALAFPLPVVRGMRPQPLILDWLDDIHDTIELLV